jgi:hypothetical protein
MRRHQGHAVLLTRPRAAVLSAALALGVAACGGGSSAKHSSSASSSTTTTSATPTPVTKPKPPTPALTIGVRTAVPPKQPFVATAAAAAGDVAQFHVTVPGGRHPATVTITVPQGAPAKTLTVTATSGKRSASVTVTGSRGKKITLQSLHFSCLLPPAPSFCPLAGQRTVHGGTALTFKTTPTAPVTLVAAVGPAPVKTTAAPGSNAVVPAYAITEQTRTVALAKPSTGAAVYGSTAVAHSGDVAVFLTRAVAKVRGAPQPVTITLQQGPATTLTATASVPGGTPSTASVTGASHGKIELVLPRFNCFAAPVPTFCPVRSVRTGSHKYVLSFLVSPLLPPVVLTAVVQSGG